jgi:hypothetical protein
MMMFSTDFKTYKFSSGLTYNEADALVEKYVSGFESPEIAIAVLKVHLKTAVRDSSQFRKVISSLIEE